MYSEQQQKQQKMKVTKPKMREARFDKNFLEKISMSDPKKTIFKTP